MIVFRGVPDYIRSDNGPEFTARAVHEWLGQVGAWVAVEKRLHREFQREVEGRSAGQRGLLYVVGGAYADGAVQADFTTGLNRTAHWAAGHRPENDKDHPHTAKIDQWFATTN